MPPGGKLYELGEGVFGYARGKGSMGMCMGLLGQVILGHWIPGRLKSPKRTIHSLLSVRKVINLHMLS